LAARPARSLPEACGPATPRRCPAASTARRRSRRSR
jgi:hypothetical protein